MRIAEFDQCLAEANKTLNEFAAEYQRLNDEHGEVSNLAMLEESLTELPSRALAPLLAVAVRRLSGGDQQAGPVRTVRPDGPRDLFGLDATDRYILAHIANGETNETIAGSIPMPVTTVQNRICRAMRRLDARNRAHLAAIYVRRYEATPDTAPYAPEVRDGDL
jgi:DNA-binding NarL/FixJ family response regulator